jgi:fermentation-respiration switch protein FrsA (DUF1100 family)
MAGVRVAGTWTNPSPPLALAPQLRIPATYVHGTDDRFIAPRDATLLGNATPDPSRVVIVPEMGHAFEDRAIAPVRESVAWTLATALSPTS